MGGRPGRPGFRSRLGGPGIVAFLVIVSFAASGCQLLAGAGLPLELPGASELPIGGTSGGSSGGVDGTVGEPGTDPSLPGVGVAPKPIATYHAGRATIQLGDGTEVVLDRLNRGPHLYAQFGSLVRWSNEGGWYLTIAGAGGEADMGPAYLTLDRIGGVRHWTADDPSSCTVGVAVATPAGLRGTATCQGVRWRDALDTSISGDHPLVDGAAPFNAIVSFEARP